MLKNSHGHTHLGVNWKLSLLHFFQCCLVKITVQLLLEKVDSKKFTSCFVLGMVVVIFHAYNDCFLVRENHESENDKTGAMIALNVI